MINCEKIKFLKRTIASGLSINKELGCAMNWMGPVARAQDQTINVWIREKIYHPCVHQYVRLCRHVEYLPLMHRNICKCQQKELFSHQMYGERWKGNSDCKYIWRDCIRALFISVHWPLRPGSNMIYSMENERGVLSVMWYWSLCRVLFITWWRELKIIEFPRWSWV